MDLVLQLFTKPTDVQTLNTCHLFLQVTLLSDITDDRWENNSYDCHQWPAAPIIKRITTISLPIETITLRLETMEQTCHHTHS